MMPTCISLSFVPKNPKLILRKIFPEDRDVVQFKINFNTLHGPEGPES